MRPIKFRAFGGATNEHPAFMINDITDWAVGDLNSASWKIMQFTGLHDKNGKEICEGDILTYDTKYNAGGKPFVVKWEVQEWDEDGFHTGFHFGVSGDQYEVLGNIYENPDLLK